MSEHDHATKQEAKAPIDPLRSSVTPTVDQAVSPDQILDRRTNDMVHTVWWVDYHAVAGRAKGTPDRKQSDQLIIDSLKIRQPGQRRATVLTGGNFADSGDVLLGEASLKRGPGTVSAAYHYGNKSAFDVKLSLDGKKAGDASALNSAHRDAMQWIKGQRDDRGDYPAMSAELQTMLAERFPGRTLTVSIVPDRGKNAGGLAAVEADYSADADSEFVVVIDPAVSRDRSQIETVFAADEDASTESDQTGVTTSTDVQLTNKIKEAQSFVSTFQTKLSQSTQKIFKHIQEGLTSNSHTTDHKHESSDLFKGGIDPAKDASAAGGKPASSGGSDGFLGKISKLVQKSGHWLYSKAKSLPIIGTGLELVGDLWDTIKVRGWVEVEHSGSDAAGGSDTNLNSNKSITELNVLETLASELSTTMTTQTQSEIEQDVATRFGLQVSQIAKKDSSKKSNTSHTVSTNRVEQDMSRPTVTIRKRG